VTTGAELGDADAVAVASSVGAAVAVAVAAAVGVADAAAEGVATTGVVVWGVAGAAVVQPTRAAEKRAAQVAVSAMRRVESTVEPQVSAD
jgi:hypothetical protein